MCGAHPKHMKMWSRWGMVKQWCSKALLVDTKFTKWSNFCVIAGAGSEFSLQAALAPGRLKPELQTGHDTKLDRFVNFVSTKWT